MEKIEDQAPKEHKRNWREVYASVDEIKDFLANRIFLRHNVITRRVEYRLASSFTQDFMPYWQPIEDRVVNSLWTKMCRIKPTRVQDIFRVIESDYVPDFNPFTDYLEHLPPWDGCNNILVLSASVAMWCAVTMRWRRVSRSGPRQLLPRTKTTLKVTTMTLVTLFSYNPSRTKNN